ncbi:MAG: adenylosuccinate synthase [Firmicutes bacterium]|nr:adenylosuccinate synthase [Bacillota bacterium]
MPALVVVGTQWGDEGKGKITDYLASKADIVVRYQGGNNAGHTIKNGASTHKLHFIPSGILHEGTLCVLGNGMVIDPLELQAEIARLQKSGVNTSNLRLSNRAHLILPYHKLIDGLTEERRGPNKIGTTRKGIGPAYMDKAARCGLRVVDLLDKEEFPARLAENIRDKNLLLQRYYDVPGLETSAVLENLLTVAELLRPYVDDTSALINDALDAGKRVVFEGAQATLLDLDHGTYPFVTASNPVAGGVCIGAGVGPTRIDKVLGVAKAYTTRVGDGPFPTELFDDTADEIRQRGNEYGTTTGRSRRVGWLDGVILRYARSVSGLDMLCLTLLDVLSGFDVLKICTHYELDGQATTRFPASIRELGRSNPVFKELPGWQEDISTCATWDELPENAKNYVREVENISGVPVTMISVGPKREQTIVRGDVF